MSPSEKIDWPPKEQLRELFGPNQDGHRSGGLLLDFEYSSLNNANQTVSTHSPFTKRSLTYITARIFISTEHFMAKTEPLHGTLDMLILKTLASESMHGFAIAQRIHELSDDALAKGDGAIYPALYRMERKGWVTSEWVQFENNRRANYYRLTRAGRKKLETAYPLKSS